MHQRLTRILALVLLLAGLASCSGSSGGGTFKLVSCSLGCGPSGGCSLNEIAVNQSLRFTFSAEVDPASVGFTTLSLKTSTGGQPTGQWFTEGASVVFRPEVQTLQGQTFFGFVPNAEYILTIPGVGAAGPTVTSRSGDQLSPGFTCVLRVARGVVDFDETQPQIVMSSPEHQAYDQSGDAPIVIEFDEFIDGAPFYGVSGEDMPIQYRLRKPNPDWEPGSGDEQYDTSGAFYVPIAGTPRLINNAQTGRTTVYFAPAQPLTGGLCVQTVITSRVRDLSGRTAAQQSLTFLLSDSDAVDAEISFDFSDDQLRDPLRSGGAWLNGGGLFATAGGDGRHGDFRNSYGTAAGTNHYVWDTDDMVIPGNDSGWLGEEDRVTDGHFYFSNFVLNPGHTLEFTGSKPARIFVRGVCQIDGRIINSGGAVPDNHNGRNSTTTPGAPPTVTPGPGQIGSAGAAAGGRGGQGAWGCDGTGQINQPTYNNFNGYDGEDAWLPAGHAYEDSAVGTAGKGAPLFPAHGNKDRLDWHIIGSWAADTAAGGGGGGGWTPGSPGRIVEAGSGFGSGFNGNTNPIYMGPPGAGGDDVTLLPKPPGTASSDHFLFGGAGGGGGASHPVFAPSVSTPAANIPKFRSGGGGAGGGGAMGIRCGDRLFVTGSIEARGGTVEAVLTDGDVEERGLPAPGGGGGGGSVLLQSFASSSLTGTIDVSGGGESIVEFDNAGGFRVKTYGGAGGGGYIRLERPQLIAPVPEDLGDTEPAVGLDNVGILEETDAQVGFQSLFRGSRAPLPPQWLRYEVEATIDGATVLFSDDPAVGVPALQGSTALWFFVQGAWMDGASDTVDPSQPLRPWRSYVGPFGSDPEESLDFDFSTGLRWMLIQDRTMSTDVVVNKVTIFFRV